MLAQRLGEVRAARKLVAELRETIADLEGKLPAEQLGRGKRSAAAAAQSVKLICPRTSNSPNAPLTARACEHVRRLVSETNGSFEGASTALCIGAAASWRR